jgi:glyoxylase-like metal-dependent hydrolase (beta-lactamase superfamily II)
MTVYCYVIGDVMIDTAQPHMKKEALKIASDHGIKRVYLTHYHSDHSGNVNAIKKDLNINIYGHSKTTKKMLIPFKTLLHQKLVWGKTTPSIIEKVPNKIETILGNMIPIHTPGHSEDHTTYFIKNEGILFSGDLYLADKVKVFSSDEDIGSQITSLKNILSLDFQTLLCSHAPRLKDGKKHLKIKLDYLENFYGNTISLWKKGIPMKQIFYSLNLKEDYFTKYFCCGEFSMINGIRSAIRHYNANNGQNIRQQALLMPR